MSKIKQEINYKEVVKKYPWIIKNGQNCILSPDSDGNIVRFIYVTLFGLEN